MLSRDYAALFLLSILGAVILSGCIFPDEDVTIDIYGPDQIAPNVTKPNGIRIRINNDVDEDIENMSVKMVVPERIRFTGNVGGRPLKLEKGLDWTYSFTTSIGAGDIREFSFTYKPEIYDEQLDAQGEFAFSIGISVSDSQGRSLGNASTTWRVVKP